MSFNIMKNTIITSIAALVLSAFIIGCSSTANQTQNEQAVITDAAALGTAYDLQQRPLDLPYFVATEQELYTIANGTNVITAKNINDALLAAGQDNKLANLGLVTAVNLANSFILQSVNTNTNSIAIQQVCGWLADGISQSVQPNLVALKAKKK
jgi:hypothetical protein